MDTTILKIHVFAFSDETTGDFAVVPHCRFSVLKR